MMKYFFYSKSSLLLFCGLLLCSTVEATKVIPLKEKENKSECLAVKVGQRSVELESFLTQSIQIGAEIRLWESIVKKNGHKMQLLDAESYGQIKSLLSNTHSCKDLYMSHVLCEKPKSETKFYLESCSALALRLDALASPLLKQIVCHIDYSKSVQMESSLREMQELLMQSHQSYILGHELDKLYCEIFEEKLNFCVHTRPNMREYFWKIPLENNSEHKMRGFDVRARLEEKKEALLGSIDFYIFMKNYKNFVDAPQIKKIKPFIDPSWSLRERKNNFLSSQHILYKYPNNWKKWEIEKANLDFVKSLGQQERLKLIDDFVAIEQPARLFHENKYESTNIAFAEYLEFLQQKSDYFYNKRREFLRESLQISMVFHVLEEFHRIRGRVHNTISRLELQAYALAALHSHPQIAQCKKLYAASDSVDDASEKILHKCRLYASVVFFLITPFLEEDMFFFELTAQQHIVGFLEAFLENHSKHKKKDDDLLISLVQERLTFYKENYVKLFSTNLFQHKLRYIPAGQENSRDVLSELLQGFYGRRG